jgi:ABC-type transport system involved in cytochrome c biogenesis permease subunit
MLLERILLVAAVAGFVLTFVLSLIPRERARISWWSGAAVLSLVLVLLFAVLAGRWLRESQGPFLTLYDVLVSNLFSLTLVFVVAAALVPALRSSVVIASAFLAVLGAWSLTLDATAVPLPATFDNPWLWLHVLSGKLFLGLCMLAAATAAMLLAPKPGAIPDDRDSAVWFTLSLAFVCHSFMLIAGAIWAHSAWGRYWAWDSLETWTFITWLAIALLLHARVTFRRMPAAVGWSAVVAIFALAILTFLGVPFLSVAPHKGVM